MPLPPDDLSQHDEDNEELSSDPEENLRLQNELLKLKMRAELGAEFGGEMSGLPPEVEQQILKQLMRFHEAQSSGEVSTVGQQLGQEEWPKADTFPSEAALTEAWTDLQDRLTRARLHVGFLADYPLSLKWDFITQELMKKETFPIQALEALQFGPEPADEIGDVEGEKLQDEADMKENDDEESHLSSESGAEDFSDDDEEEWDSPGMPAGLTGVGFMGFIYEEYYPNHSYSIENKVQDLLKDFFENSFGERPSGLSSPLNTDSGEEVSIEVFLQKVARFHDLFAGGIKEWEFIPGTTFWDTPLDDDGKAASGAAFVEGTVKYVVTTDDGAESEVSGPFRAHLGYRDEWWSVNSFHLHGFSWMY